MATIAVLLSISKKGTTAKQFQLIHQVCTTVFNEVHYLTKGGLPPIFDIPSPSKWANELEQRDYTAIDIINNEYKGLVIPDGLGYYEENCEELGRFIESFIKYKSNNSLIRTNMYYRYRICLFGINSS
jgi:hypothetical protein